jgi:hypothetical protein
MPLFVVVREIDASWRDYRVFVDLGEARAAYDAAAYICDNAPDEGDADAAVISRCWLYETPAVHADIAKSMAADGRGKLLDSYDE